MKAFMISVTCSIVALHAVACVFVWQHGGLSLRVESIEERLDEMEFIHLESAKRVAEQSLELKNFVNEATLELHDQVKESLKEIPVTDESVKGIVEARVAETEESIESNVLGPMSKTIGTITETLENAARAHASLDGKHESLRKDFDLLVQQLTETVEGPITKKVSEIDSRLKWLEDQHR